MKIIALLIFFLISQGRAQTKLGLFGSLLYNVPQFDGKDSTEIKEKSSPSFGLGMRALMELKDQLHIRSGVGFSQKRIDLNSPNNSSSEDVTLTNTYLNIPLTGYWEASSQVGFFGGTSIYALLSDQREGGWEHFKSSETEVILFPLSFGFDFIFSNFFSLELYYEYALMETTRNLKINSAILAMVFQFN